MKFILKTFLLLLILVTANNQCLQAQVIYKTKKITIPTRWTNEVSPKNVLPDYPRPQLVRKQWQNLNGLWDYAITEKKVGTPKGYNGKILVPYPLESALSGVQKSLQPTQNLWYRRLFQSPSLKSGERLLLNFGAVDWQATVFINGKQIGEHTGGYTGFTFDVTDALKKGNNEVVVKVFDPTDQGIGPHGKQVLRPQNIYYTPSSGIWQTVWMEVVPIANIRSLTITPNIDKSQVEITVNSAVKSTVQLIVEGRTIESTSNVMIVVPVKNAKLWSPTSPYLYDFIAKLGNDIVKSYFGMRKVSIQKDEQGVDRIFLNNKYTYNLGTLDQGFWPDGLYTAPTDAALSFDIKAIKAMGFNTIRKHIKVEPARWYYHADKLGMLVWQDMVNPNQGLSEGSKAEFERESQEMLVQLHNYPSITTWVLFNEKWGQYDQERLTKWIKKTDPSRLVNGHSGEYLYVNKVLRSPSPDAYISADMTDVHSYPNPMLPIKQQNKVQVCGEFGGIGVPIEGHLWDDLVAGWGMMEL
jgi:beta-galactosidase/beta-glucuronidase